MTIANVDMLSVALIISVMKPISIMPQLRQPFAEACFQYNQQRKAAYYIAKMSDPRDKIDYYMKAG